MLAKATASTWSLSLQGSIDGVGFQIGFQVTVPDPEGVAVVTVAGVPVTVTHTADQLAFLVNTSFSQRGCTVFLFVSGLADIGAGGGTAPGALTGLRRSVCTVPSATGIFIPPPPPPPVPPPGSFLTERPIGGSFVAQKIGGANEASVLGVVGTVRIRTSRSSQPALPGLVVTPGTLIETGPDGSASLLFLDGSQLTVGPSSLVTVVPPTPAAPAEIILNQVTGVLNHTVQSAPGSGPDRYRVQTAIWAIRPTGTQFTTTYGENNTVADLAVAVQQGIVDVTNRRAEIDTVLAGTQQTFQDTVPRVTLMLPANRSTVAAGVSHAFMWTLFPGAAGYLFEYTFNPTGFALANAPAPELPATTVRVGPGLFLQTGSIIEFPVFVPGGVVPSGARRQWRVFPTNAAGQVLAGSTASDAYTLTVE